MNVRDFKRVSEQVDYTELEALITSLDSVLSKSVVGDIVEFGCYEGTTSLFIARLLKERRSNKQLHVYDSFEGLPPKTKADSSPAGEQFTAGALRASKQQFIKNFKQTGLRLPIIHKTWFADITPDDVPEAICFAFLDGDFYESIGDSLRCIQNRLAPGAVLVVDDYQAEALPGARRAVDEWLQVHPACTMRVIASLAIIYT